jgi:predicted acylesterase/phospholipase RssA
MKIPIRYYLSGGGLKCCYQLTFIKNIMNDSFLKDHIYIDKIYGTSFGAVIGYCICLSKYDIMREYCLSLKSDNLIPCCKISQYINRLAWFNNYSILKVVYKILTKISNLLWLINGVKNKGFYLSTNGLQFLNDIKVTKKDNPKLSKFYCCVFNVTLNKIQYICGIHPLITTYITASCALWLFFKPIFIKQLKNECSCTLTCKCNCSNDIYCECSIYLHRYNEFIDGGILKPIPYVRDKKYNGFEYILTVDNLNNINNNKSILNTNNNLLKYLNNIINYLITYTSIKELLTKIKKYKKKKRMLELIEYIPPINDPILIDNNIINIIFNDGYVMSNYYITKMKNIIKNI